MHVRMEGVGQRASQSNHLAAGLSATQRQPSRKFDARGVLSLVWCTLYAFPSTHLGDAQKHRVGRRVVKAQRDVSGFV